MSDTWSGSSSTSWFTGGNWSGGVPTISATGSETVVISGTVSNQPVIPYNQTEITVAQTVYNNGTVWTSTLTETQIGGEIITLTNGADLTIQGIAMGIFYGNTDTLTAKGGTMKGLHGATTTTPNYDSHMEVVVTGTDALTVETINENFGLITIGSSDTLTILNTFGNGANAQDLHGLINYGLIAVGSGGALDIADGAGSGGTVANFYNAGWIVDNGGTLNISSSVLDGANTASSATSIDGYIELEGGANAIMSSTVASHEEVLFADSSANTLQVTAGTLFNGTVAGFGSTDAIIVNGFTSTSNATLVASGSNTDLITTNGSVLTTITLAGALSGVATGTNSSTKQEFIVLNGGTLSGSTLSGGTTFSSGTVSLGGTSTPTLTLSGTVGVTGSGTDAQVNSSLSGNGTLFIDNGATLALDNPTGTDAGVTVLFGTHGSASAPNTLILNDNASGFGGKVTGFGVNDEIVIGSKVLAQPSAGQGLVLSYNSTTGVLTVEDTSSSTGSIVSSTQFSLSGTAAGALSASSFVALEGSSGIDIELAPTAAASFTFSTSGTGSFEQASNFSGGTAPGDIITSNETVSIAKGTASISSGGVSENGLITVGSAAGFIDTGSLTGTGTLNVASGGSATLTGNTTLAAISDAGTLVLGGSDTAAITLASGAQATIASKFSDSSAITGPGTLTVNSGVTATLASGSSIASIIDAGTLDLAGATGGAINMQGNGAHSVVDFTGSSSSATLTNFGTTDDIILGTGALPTLTAGESIALGYNGSVLTVGEVNAGGTTVSTAQVTVSGVSGTTLSAASFVALQGTNGENIELASGLAGQTFNFSTSGTGSFETPADYTGGVAPGDSIATSEVVTIAAGTASVSGAALVDNGTINVGTGFIDTGSLTGTGTLAVASGANATITGNTTLGSITDAGTLVLGGSDAEAITLASGAQATIASKFSDSSAITGPGTLTVNSGVTATLASGSSIASIIDAGTLDLAGATGGAINMQGNGAHSVVDFTGSSSSATLTNFGTTDDIILGTGALTQPGTASGLVLSYNTSNGVLTVEDTAAGAGSIISTANVTVSGTSAGALSTSSFVALESAAGVNLELASGLSGQTFNFSTSGTGSFETPADYTGGVAPGDIIASGETVSIASGTATVASGSVTDNGQITVASTFIDTGSLTGTGTLAVASGANATITGNTTLGSITDAGTLVLGGSDAAAITLASGAQATIASNFSDSSAITGPGTLTVNSGVTATLAAGSSFTAVNDFGTLNLLGSLTTPINMEGNGAGSIADFSGTDVTGHVLDTALTNFGTGDTIILGASNFSLSGTTDKLTESYNNGTLVVTDTTDGASVTIDVSLTSGDSASWLQANDSNDQLVLTLCFYPGTRIATPEGEVEVEALRAGDLVLTANGAKPVRWVGQSQVHTRFADPLRSLPIRIKAGALGYGLPARDLLLSPDHAVFIDGILAQAGALVNGTTIVREQDVPEQFTYYHVELASHELLLAEGVQAESFVDNVDRMHFHNWDEREAPAEAIEEMPYPRAKAARQVPMAIRRRLNGTAANAA
jgi:hypothetical protein